MSGSLRHRQWECKWRQCNVECGGLCGFAVQAVAVGGMLGDKCLSDHNSSGVLTLLWTLLLQKMVGAC